MGFQKAQDAFACMESMGATRFYIKHLKANDNSKQQIYLGSSLEAIRVLPSEDLREDGTRLKAKVSLHWVDGRCRSEAAPGAQLILYPDYPEVRLSGFLRGCSLAPRERMVPLSKEERETHRDIPRALLLGLTDEGAILAYASDWDDSVARSAIELIRNGEAVHAAAVLFEWTPRRSKLGRRGLKEKLAEVYRRGWIESFHLDKNGNAVPYRAKNGAGYTLEALLGITPNGRPEPDLLGWEIKSHRGKGSITLMTPEPTRGLYARDFPRFMGKYGRLGKGGDRIDFTNAHRCGVRNKTTGLTLMLDGVANKGPTGYKIVDPTQGLHLYDDEGALVAGWAYTDLLDHWKRKHGNTAFVGYEPADAGEIRHYRFGPAVTLAEGADFSRFLKALADGIIVYDPGCNMKRDASAKTGWRPKRRNQIRISWKALDAIYDAFHDLDLSQP